MACTDKAIALHDVDLSLGRGAARVHILKGISLDDRPRRGGRARRSLGLRQVDPAHDHGGPGAARFAAASSSTAPISRALDEDALARFRGRRIGIVFQSFHLVPTMTALRERRPAAGARRRATTPSSAPRPSCGSAASATACTIIRPSSRAASSSASPSPAPSRPIRRSWSPTSRPAISTRPPARSIVDLLFALQARPRRDAGARHPRSQPRPRCATAPCACARAGSRPSAAAVARLSGRLTHARLRSTRLPRRRPRGRPGAAGLPLAPAPRLARAARRPARASAIFLACIALGVAAIAGVASPRRAR